MQVFGGRVPQGVKYVSLAEPGGYGVSALAYLRGLMADGVPLTWQPLTWRAGGYRPVRELHEIPTAVLDGDRALATAVCRPIGYDVVLLHTVPEYWPALRDGGKRCVGYTVWETDRLPAHWPALLNAMNAILTPSEFSATAMRRSGVRVPVHVVPHLPAAAAAPDPGAVRSFRHAYGIPDSHFLFYTADSWALRKAWWKTLHAFLLAFTARDAVSLLVKTGPTAETETDAPGSDRTVSKALLAEILSDYPDPPKVVLETATVRAYDMSLLHHAGDAYVSLTRGEGWGLGAYDAAAAGNPVIITGWGGQCEFLPAEHACLVNHRLVPVRHPLAPHSYHPDQRWADADLDDAIRWLRRFAANPDEARARGRALAQNLRRDFDAARIIARFRRALENGAPR